MSRSQAIVAVAHLFELLADMVASVALFAAQPYVDDEEFRPVIQQIYQRRDEIRGIATEIRFKANDRRDVYL